VDEPRATALELGARFGDRFTERRGSGTQSKCTTGSSGCPPPARHNAILPCCVVGGPCPQRHRRAPGHTRTKSKSRMARLAPGCDANVSLLPAGTPYQFRCAEIVRPEPSLGEP